MKGNDEREDNDCVDDGPEQGSPMRPQGRPRAITEIARADRRGHFAHRPTDEDRAKQHERRGEVPNRAFFRCIGVASKDRENPDANRDRHHAWNGRRQRKRERTRVHKRATLTPASRGIAAQGLP